MSVEGKLCHWVDMREWRNDNGTGMKAQIHALEAYELARKPETLEVLLTP
jgi:hypothetical protein